MKLQLFSITLLASFMLTGTDAFTPSSAGKTLRHDISLQSSKRSHHYSKDVVETKSRNMKDFLLCTATAIVFAVTPILPVSASSYSDIDRLPSIQIADNVKELDFSLPSYEDIKSSKASAENAKSLTIQPKAFDPKSISLRTTSSSLVESDDAVTTSTTTGSDDSASSTTSSNPLSSILPSMSKKGPKQKASYDGYTF